MKKWLNSKRIMAFLVVLIFLFTSTSFAYAARKVTNLKITYSSPVNGEKDVGVWANIEIKFNQNLKQGKAFKGIRFINNKKSISLLANINKNTLFISPDKPYKFEQVYSVVIPKNALAGTGGGVQNSDIKISFTTQSLVTKDSEDQSNDKPPYYTEAQQFYDFMIANYPFLEMSKSMMGYDFEKNRDEILDTLGNSFNEYDFGTNEEKILEKLLPGTHTGTTHAMFYVPREVRFSYLNGEYIIMYSINPDIKVGDVITKINGIPIDDYVKNSGNIMITGTDVKRNKVNTISNVFLSYGAVKMTIRNNENVEKDFDITFQEYKFDYENRMIEAMNNLPKTEMRIIKENEAAYLRIPTFMMIDTQNVDKFIGNVSNYKYLILDVRGNGGGLIQLAKYLMSRVINKPISVTNYIVVKNTDSMKNYYKSPYNIYDETEELTSAERDSMSILPDEVKNDSYKVYRVKVNAKPNEIHFNGKLFILTDGGCYSATEYLSNTLKRAGAATLVGADTGGDGILFAPDVMMFMGPDKIGIRFSYTIGIQDNGTINQISHTAPDVYVEQNKEDYIKYLTQGGDSSDYDTVLKKCIEIIESELAGSKKN